MICRYSASRLKVSKSWGVTLKAIVLDLDSLDKIVMEKSTIKVERSLNVLNKRVKGT
jgi:hypothetical protein